MRPTLRKLAFSNSLFLTGCPQFMAHTEEATMPQLHTFPITIHPANCCLKKKKIQLSKVCHKGVVSCYYSLPKQMHVVTGGRIQGLTTPGPGGHTALSSVAGRINTNSKICPAALKYLLRKTNTPDLMSLKFL